MLFLRVVTVLSSWSDEPEPPMSGVTSKVLSARAARGLQCAWLGSRGRPAPAGCAPPPPRASLCVFLACVVEEVVLRVLLQTASDGVI